MFEDGNVWDEVWNYIVVVVCEWILLEWEFRDGIKHTTQDMYMYDYLTMMRVEQTS